MAEDYMKLTPLKIAAAYVLVGGLWILLSDRLLSEMVTDPLTLTRLQTFKGWLFIAVTGVMLYWLISRYTAKQRESEEKFRNMAEKSLVGIYIIQDGLFRYVNPRVAEIFGYTVDELIDKKGPRDLVYPDDWQIVEENIRKRISGEIESIQYDFRGITKNKEVINVKVYGTRTIYKGKPSVVGTLLDITEHSKLEEQLRQAQKMEAVGQLAGGIAHDFNNMLTTIIGFGSLMRMNMSKDDPLMSYVEQILTSSEKAANLTQSLLAFSRKQIISPKPVNLNEIIRGVEKLILRLIGEDIEIKSKLIDKDLIIMADAGQIEQVLMNFAANARDAMPRGGRLVITTEIVKLDNEFIKTHGYGKPGIYAVISVADTGMGMDENTKERIFEPFFTTKELGRGTGLGLAIVYGIIKQHDGYINVYSELGKGTTFKIYLPVIESEIENIELEEYAAPAGGSETILVAEDDADVSKLIKTILEGYGYKVIEAVDGEDAVFKFIENKDKVQILILDVIMPKKHGREAYEEIKKISPDIKAVFMSGYTADIINKKGILEEGIDFISKPILPDDLLRKVREVLDK
jgi:PAS domain S-box-containing protein